jgi:putative transposase
LDSEAYAYGYRKLTICLRRKYRLCINKKKVYRLLKEMGLLKPYREVRHRTPKKVSRYHEVTGPNQLWQMDIKYGYIAGERRHFFLASIIDVFDRMIVGYYTGKVCKTSAITKMVHEALLKRNVYAEGSLPVIRTDNGPQFCSKAFYAFCESRSLEHERIPTCAPNKNAYIESFHSLLENECYGYHVFDTYKQAEKAVQRYIRFYNERRIHGSLGDLSPAEFHKKFRNGEISPQKMAV